MKLYDVPRNSYIKLITDDEIRKESVIHFHRIDGLYSLCEVPEGFIHVNCTAEVKIVTKEDYYDCWGILYNIKEK